MTTEETPKPLSFKNPKHSRLTRLTILKERGLYLFMGLLIVIIIMLANKITKPDIVTVQEEKLLRTEIELITAAKRFVSCFYSVDAATIREDQFCAIDMMLNEDDRAERKDYLIRTGLIRTSEKKGIKSHFLWHRADIKLTENNDTTFDVFINLPYRIIGITNQQLNIIVTLTPIAISAKNSLGVGIVKWRDLAKQPFPEK